MIPPLESNELILKESLSEGTSGMLAM